MRTGGALAGAFASALCMQNAALLGSGESQVSASVLGNLGFLAVARQIRRLSGPFGGAVRRDGLEAADLDMMFGNGDDFAAWVPRWEAKKAGG